jgi:site-specific recombinase XerD
VTEVESIIEPDGVADDIERESVSFVGIHRPILSNLTSLFVSTILDQLGTETQSEWLFTCSRGDGKKRLTTISKAWQRIRQDADLAHVRLHDLRHMHASMLINSGHSLYIVQQVLGHSDPSVTQRYSHLSTATLHEAANSAGTYLEKALEKKS